MAMECWMNHIFTMGPMQLLSQAGENKPEVEILFMEPD